MSIRRRLLVVLALAAVALVAAIFAIVDVLTRTESARIQTLEASLVDVTNALALDPGPDRLSVLALRVPEGLVGLCDADGHIVESRGAHAAPKPPLPPDQRAFVEAACRRSTTSPQTASLRHPHDVVVLVTRRTDSPETAFALSRLPLATADGEERWKLDLGLVSLASVLLAAFTISAVRAVGRGANELEGALVTLRTDLRAPLERSTTTEFGRIGDGLSELAHHLADAHDKEKELTLALEHRARLSGLGRVVAGVAHEIRNPLAGVKLKLDVLERRRDVGVDIRADVQACLGEIARLDRLVQSLLVVARKPRRFEHSVALGPFIAQSVERVGPLAAEKQVVLRCEGEASARIDEDELGRALDNLLRNAIEASPSGETVTVEIESSPSNVTLRVVDRGAGVAQSIEKELFEPFASNKSDGTGLGLWLSRALVEAHGGTLTYERTSTETRFVIRLPVEA